MKNNYKKIALTITLILSSTLSLAASVADKSSVWFDRDTTNGGLTAAQAISVNADTVTFWNSGEPNDSSSEDCATQTNTGVWNDIGCELTRRVACFNGTNWSLTSGTVAMGADNNASGTISNAQTACTNIGSQFAAPVTLEQRNALTSLISSAGITNGVFINAQDMIAEGVWVINKGTTAVAPFWSGSEPNNSGGAENCAESTSGGSWNDLSCSAQRAVACANAAFSDWQILTTARAFTSVDEMNEACRSASGGTYQFAAPRTSAEQNDLNSALAAAAVSSAWINASDSALEGYWMLNHNLFNWASAQPDFNSGLCTTVRQSDGKWLSADCDSSANLLCSDGDSWVLRNVIHVFSNALDACSRPDSDALGVNPYRNYFLAAPQSEHQRAQVTRLIQAAGNSVTAWINLRAITDVNQWLWNDLYSRPTAGGDLKFSYWFDVYDDNYGYLNGPWYTYPSGTAVTTPEAALKSNLATQAYFAFQEPNDSGDCVSLITEDNGQLLSGQWDDDTCSKALPVVCYDGYDWVVTAASYAIGSDQNTNGQTENLTSAFNACASIEKDGVTGNFVFAAPTTFQQNRAVLALARSQGVSTGAVWININDLRYEHTFVYNLGMDVAAPFWNTGEPNDAGTGEDCAVQQQSSKRWNDVSCTASRQIACFNPAGGINGSWAITTASSSFTSSTALSLMCEQEFGGPYKFYAPMTLSQRDDLVALMTSSLVTEVLVNATDSATEGVWALNQNVNNWASGQPSAVSSEQCVSASADDASWQSRNCSATLPVACSSGNRWYFSSTTTNLMNFSDGQRVCDELGQGYFFAAPRTYDNALLMQYFAKLAGVGGDFWINGNRLGDFSVWEWNQFHISLPLWGTGEPNGGSNANCALLNNNTQATWSDENCAAAQNHFYLCRNGDNWAMSSVQGDLSDFSNAVTACTALGGGWLFAAPTNYNENIAAKNAMGAESSV